MTKLTPKNIEGTIADNKIIKKLNDGSFAEATASDIENIMGGSTGTNVSNKFYLGDNVAKGKLLKFETYNSKLLYNYNNKLDLGKSIANDKYHFPILGKGQSLSSLYIGLLKQGSPGDVEVSIQTNQSGNVPSGVQFSTYNKTISPIDITNESNMIGSVDYGFGSTFFNSGGSGTTSPIYLEGCTVTVHKVAYITGDLGVINTIPYVLTVYEGNDDTGPVVGQLIGGSVGHIILYPGDYYITRSSSSYATGVSGLTFLSNTLFTTTSHTGDYCFNAGMFSGKELSVTECEFTGGAILEEGILYHIVVDPTTTNNSNYYRLLTGIYNTQSLQGGMYNGSTWNDSNTIIPAIEYAENEGYKKFIIKNTGTTSMLGGLQSSGNKYEKGSCIFMGVVGGYNNLSIGTVYYINGDSISPTGSVVVGKAISETELLFYL